jgi:hypothetical protein
VFYRSSLLCAASLYFIFCVSRRVETDDNVVVDDVDEADEEEIEDGGGEEEEEDEEDVGDQQPTTTSSSSSTSTTLATTTTTVAPPSSSTTLPSGCSAEERAECEQICWHSVDSLSNSSTVTCSCYRGFRLDVDAKSCLGIRPFVCLFLIHLIKVIE